MEIPEGTVTDAYSVTTSEKRAGRHLTFLLSAICVAARSSVVRRIVYIAVRPR